MRILIVPAAAMFLVAAPALAKMPGEIGIRAGVNLAAFGGRFGGLVEPDNRIAPNVSLVWEHPLAPKLAFRSEVGWSGKGGTVKSEGVDQAGNVSERTSEWQFDYIEVPLLLRGRFGSLGKVTPFFELGPSVGITVAGKFKDDFLGEQDLKHLMKAFDAGWAAGAGVEFAAGSGRIGLEARYTRGFSDLYNIDRNVYNVDSDLESINQAWTFAVSFVR